MIYDRRSKKNDLILLGHMCSLRIEAKKIGELLRHLRKKNIKYTHSLAKSGKDYYISFYFSTKQIAQNAYDIILEWNP